MNAITHALDYIGRGWLVVPVGKRQKRPISDEWQKQKITSDSVTQYFKPDFNVGVLLGDESGGLVDVDLDCPETIALATELVPATRAFGRESSPRSHLLYYAMHARTEKFAQPLAGNKKKMLVEIRANKSAGDGLGLQTVFPGSVHESGERVEWEDDGAEILRIPPEQLRVAVARLASAALLMRTGWPFARALAFGREPNAADIRGAGDTTYALIARWLGFAPLEPAAPPPPARRTSSGPPDNRVKRAAAYLARIPGGVSGAGGHDQTWIAALAVVRGFDLTEGEAYSLLAGDFNGRCDPPWSERELRHKIADALNNARLERGYLLKQERGYANGNGANGNGANGANGHHHHASPAPAPAAEPETPAEWEPPVDFGVFALPAFPVDALPSVLGDFVSALAVATQTPPDLPGMMVLAACAATCAKRIVVEVKTGYREPLNLFTLAVLPSGHRKSAVVEEVTRPLREWEAQRAEEVAPDLARHAQKWAISKKRLESTSDRAAKAKTKAEREQLEREVEDLTEQHNKLTVPVEPRVLADDVTPEALGSLLATYEGRIAILSAEGGVFQQMAGKYSDSPSLDVYLKAHAGDEIRVDRKGRASERVSKPALTLGISPQPIILEALAEKQMLRGTGLLARFLYALPTSMLGARTGDPPPVPDAVRSAYGSALRRLLLLQQQKHTLTLKFSPEAYAAWREFYLWVEPQLGEGGELESISDWGSKLPGAVARVAGVLSILSILSLKTHSEDQSISIYVPRDEVVRAITLGRYLVPHAQAAFSSMGADPKTHGAKHILKTVRRKRWTSFSRRELHQLLRHSERFDVAEKLEPMLSLLVERGFIRPAQSPSMSERGPGRRQSERYEVNPHTHAQNPQNPQNPAVQSLPERTPGEDDA